MNYKFKCRLPVALAIICAMAGSSCSFVRLRGNVQQIEKHGVVTVEASPVSPSAPTYALAWVRNAKGSNELAAFNRLETNGLAIFLLLQDRTYSIGAFTDVNGNGRYDGGEPVDVLRDIRPAPLADTKASATTRQLRLSPTNGLPRGQSIALPPENEDLGASLALTLGSIADLDAEKFSADTGQKGMWQPYTFLREHGIGIYFLEPYDPKKLPVVFVNGISGSFQDWRPILGKLDRSKYQPWLFYYPSGIRLDKAANTLAGGLLQLRQQHSFDRLVVVAHSMGGLIARTAIQRAAVAAGTNFIPEFVTISTPWAGHTAAATGVKYARYPVPAWRDMSPGSEFLKELLAQPLPEGTRHDLMFGYRSSGGFGLPEDNDGVVAVSSELAEPVQGQAASVFGLHLNHDEILQSPIVLQRLEEFLGRMRGTAEAPHGIKAGGQAK
jgi:pimeloyl-ACP methyl ester carboxylesterase